MTTISVPTRRQPAGCLVATAAGIVLAPDTAQKVMKLVQGEDPPGSTDGYSVVPSAR